MVDSIVKFWGVGLVAGAAAIPLFERSIIASLFAISIACFVLAILSHYSED